MGTELQYRWQLEQDNDQNRLVYYGLRNRPKNARQVIPVSQKAADILCSLTQYSAQELTAHPQAGEELGQLLNEQIIVSPEELRQPATRDNYQVCTQCLNNDLIIPGLEFDTDGVCAFCQCYTNNETPKQSGIHVVDEQDLAALADTQRKSRFDVMVFFTGGKDSSFLLWYLARKLKLRVLAAFWDMPYTSDTARENMKRVEQHLPEVEFIQWQLPWKTISQAMKDQLRNIGWPCLCPTTAFPLFYPIAFRQQIPFILFGMEDVQAAVMEYVFPAPARNTAPPPSAREQTLQFLKTRTAGCALQKPVSWMQELKNYHASIRQVVGDEIFAELSAVIKQAEDDPSLTIPLIKRLRTREKYGSWHEVIALLQRELDWQMPEDQKSMLHTSCKIEPVKDYVQYMRFKKMRTVFFPQSLVELSAAVFFGQISREDAMEQAEDLGFPDPPDVLSELICDLEISDEDILTSADELKFVLEEYVTS